LNKQTYETLARRGLSVIKLLRELDGIKNQDGYIYVDFALLATDIIVAMGLLEIHDSELLKMMADPNSAVFYRSATDHRVIS